MRLFLCLVMAVMVSPLFAQDHSDSIHVAKSFLGYKFYYQESRINFNALPSLMENNTEAYEVIKKAKNKQVASSVIGGVGGFLVAVKLGAMLAGIEANWAIAGVGAGLIVISIPLSSRSYGQALYAIDKYNQSLANTTRKPVFNIGSSPNGFGLMVNF